MSTTANLVLPYVAPGQAQKHVTVNESLRRLDAIVQLSVASATTSAQPASPTDGAVYILPAGKTGAAWGAMANGALAYWRDGSWETITPREGWLAFVRDTDTLQMFNGSSWTLFTASVAVSAPDRILGRVAAGAGPVEEIACTAAARALLDDADAAAQRTTLGLGIGTNVQGFSANLTALSGLSGVADRLAYFTGSGAMALATFTTFGRSLVDDADAAAGRATLGLGTAATQATGTSGATVPLLNGANTWSAIQTLRNTTGAYTLIEDTAGTNGQTGVQMNARNSGGTLNPLFLYSYRGQFRAYVEGNDRLALDSTIASFGVSVLPGADNTYNLGSGSFRWGTVFAATGTINTSDAREKTDLRAINDAERRVIQTVMGGVGVFQWRDSVARKGADRARLHIGVTAQAVAAAFEAEGLDPGRYALFCEDPLFEEVELEPARAIPATDDAPERMIPAVCETRPVIDPETGQQAKRLGVRYDQLVMLALGSGA